MKDFRDKVAVITGGASGIGRGITERCLSEGMKVVLADVDEETLARTESELKSAGGAVLGVMTDVSKRVDVESLAHRTLDSFGGVHLLVNNAGIGAGGSPWEATWNDWEWAIGVNLWGVIHGVKVFTPIMLAQNVECHIVNTASAAGLTVGDGSTPYAVTKHGVVALSESLYFALQRRTALVGVSVLCPGLVQTDIMNSERRRPKELQNPPVEMTPQMQAGLNFMKAAVAAGMPPARVADIVFEAIRNGQFYVVTHPDWMEAVRMRTDSVARLENPRDARQTVLKIIQGGS